MAEDMRTETVDGSRDGVGQPAWPDSNKRFFRGEDHYWLAFVRQESVISLSGHCLLSFSCLLWHVEYKL